MTKENSVVVTGVFTTRQITDSFVGQMLAFDSKRKDGSWGTGHLDIYIKDDLLNQYGIAPGDTIKVKGFIVFNFFTRNDGTETTFPKIIVTDILEVEKAGTVPNQYGSQPQQAQPQAQPQMQTQPQPQAPNTYAAGVPPVPGSAPTAPAVDAAPAFETPGAPPVPPIPGQ
jgi:hypothetical protein